MLAPRAKRITGADIDLRPLRAMMNTMPLPKNVELIDIKECTVLFQHPEVLYAKLYKAYVMTSVCH